MTDRPFNPDDLEFLISQELDGDLSMNQRQRLDQARAASAELQQTSAAFASVDRLLGRWTDRGVELDWEATAALTNARIRGEDAGHGDVDAMLQRWSKRTLDDRTADLSTSVLKRIRAAERGTDARRLIFRMSAPLAMAAAIALVVFGTTWFERLEKPVTVVSIRTTIDEPTLVEESPRTIVSFGRPNIDAVARDTTPPSIGFITLGAGPESNAGEVAPL